MSRGNHKKDCEVEAVALSSIVPAGTPDWITAELIEATIRVWQPYYAELLSPEEAVTQPYYAELLSPEEAVTMIQSVGRLYQALSSGSPP